MALYPSYWSIIIVYVLSIVISYLVYILASSLKSSHPYINWTYCFTLTLALYNFSKCALFDPGYRYREMT